MNRFGLGERHCPNLDNDLHTNKPLLTLAYLHYWDKGMRVPADIAARLIEEGYEFNGGSPMQLLYQRKLGPKRPKAQQEPESSS